MLKKLRAYLRYEQKKHWHRMATSYFETGSTILDVGCGVGYFLQHVEGSTVVGLDWNPQNLAEAEEVASRAIEGDARSIPMDDLSVDGIHCSHLIEHFEPADVHQILREMDRVLRPGGVLVIRSPCLWSGFYDNLTHVRPYHPQAIRRYLCAGWEQQSLGPVEGRYREKNLHWRYKPLHLGIPLLDGFLTMLNRWGFPWWTITGYMLVLRKVEEA